jgi:type I restriction-modification system DNA methylase subunit
MSLPIPTHWIDHLQLARYQGNDLIVTFEQAAQHPYAHILRDAFSSGVSGIFCVDGVPSTAIVTIPSPETTPIRELNNLYKILWNQSELDFLLLLFDDAVVVHSLRAKPNQCSEDDLPTRLKKLNFFDHVQEIESLFSGIESGRLSAEHKSAFEEDQLVDTSLINDLDGIRRQLLFEEGYNLGDDVPPTLLVDIHDVLLQAMFLLYLNHRGIIVAGYIKKHGDKASESLHLLLRRSPQKFTCLLKHLDSDFNGGIFAVNTLWERHQQTMARFLEGKYCFETNEPRLLQIYQFDHIPVELLSEVYDRFQSSEGTKKDNGAYYTPRRLAMLTVEQVWEKIKPILATGRIPKILDPACGSGIFLASLFQRITSYFHDLSWEDYKQLASCLHGLDVNETAIRISAFSLSLALLNKRHPKELQKHIESEDRILPELLGITLIKQDFFKYSTNTKYDFIIGNPPWGRAKGLKTIGETWVTQKKYPNPPNREKSWPFIWKSLEHLHIHGVLALLLPSNGFFINNVTKSLTHLLGYLRLDKLIDLTDLQNILFKNATFPACILFANREKEIVSHSFTYICPKADLNSTNNNRILLASDDKHQISAFHFAKNSVEATQCLMWATPLERKLFNYIRSLSSLHDLPLLSALDVRKKIPGNSRPEWGMGLGFQSHTGNSDKMKQMTILNDLPYVPINQFAPWVQPDVSACDTYGKTIVSREKFFDGFTAPHIVLPRSLTNGRLKASYSEKDFSFNDTFIGITVPNSEKGRETGKFLTAFLNSSFIAWFAVFMGFSVYRTRFTPHTILSLPFPTPKELHDAKQAQNAYEAIVRKMDELLQQAEALQIKILQPKIIIPDHNDISILDNLVFSYLGLRPEEIIVINESVNLVRKAAHPTRRGKIPDLWLDSQEQHWDDYCKWLGITLTKYMHKDLKAVASVETSSRDIVIIKITRQNKKQTKNSLNNELKKFPSVYNNLLNKCEKPLSGNIYLQRCVLIFDKGEIHLLKPRQRRFWLTSAAFADADRIMEHLLSVTDAEKDIQ